MLLLLLLLLLLKCHCIRHHVAAAQQGDLSPSTLGRHCRSLAECCICTSGAWRSVASLAGCSIKIGRHDQTRNASSNLDRELGAP